jgi:hypothetical protein
MAIGLPFKREKLLSKNHPSGGGRDDELVIEANGKANLFDGPSARRVDQFCFQSL